MDTTKHFRMLTELRKRLSPVHLGADDHSESGPFTLSAGDRTSPYGVLVDLGDPYRPFGTWTWNETTGRLHGEFDGEPEYETASVEDARAHTVAVARGRIRRLRRGEIAG